MNSARPASIRSGRGQGWKLAHSQISGTVRDERQLFERLLACDRTRRRWCRCAFFQFPTGKSPAFDLGGQWGSWGLERKTIGLARLKCQSTARDARGRFLDRVIPGRLREDLPVIKGQTGLSLNNFHSGSNLKRSKSPVRAESTPRRYTPPQTNGHRNRQADFSRRVGTPVAVQGQERPRFQSR